MAVLTDAGGDERIVRGNGVARCVQTFRAPADPAIRPLKGAATSMVGSNGKHPQIHVAEAPRG